MRAGMVEYIDVWNGYVRAVGVHPVRYRRAGNVAKRHRRNTLESSLVREGIHATGSTPMGKVTTSHATLSSDA
jgi:hypothetical protein